MTWHLGADAPEYHGVSVGDMIAYEVTRWLISVLKDAAENGPGRSTESTYSFQLDKELPRDIPRSMYSAGREVARVTFDNAHDLINRVISLRGLLRPGFQRSKGLRGVLFDPYVGYEGVLPELFGTEYSRAIVPRPNVRRMPRIVMLQRRLGVRTFYCDLQVRRIDERNAAALACLVHERATRVSLTPPLDMPGSALLWPRLGEMLGRYCASLVKTACKNIETAEHLLIKHRIDATVLPWDEFGLYKAVALVAQREGLLTIRFQHGVTNRYPAFVPPTSNKVVVWDHDAWTYYRSLGVAEDRLALLPNPMLPEIKALSANADIAALRRRFKLNSGGRVVLFTETPFCGLSALERRTELDVTLRDLATAVRGLSNAQLVVKVHPNNTNAIELARVTDIVRKYSGPSGRVLMEGDTREAILLSDVVVGETSTCLWEATVMGRPAIGYTNRPFVREVYCHGVGSGIVRADSPESLARALAAVLDVGTRPSSPYPRSSEGPIARIHEAPRPEYFNDPRWEIVSIVPARARRVLDVGCGAGWIGEHLKRSRPCRVVGIEGNSAAAIAARTVLDDVHVGDLNEFVPSFEPGSFDCMIFSDVLEHLSNPQAVLSRYLPFLRTDGTVVISLPNISHYTTILSLLRNRWDYADQGLLDRTHLRFFCRHGIEGLLREAGLTPIRMLANTSAGRAMRAVAMAGGGHLDDMITFQHLVVARRDTTGTSS